MAAILERKDVIGVFCGHDHDNNYIGSYRGLRLATVRRPATMATAGWSRAAE
ncbi:hypothetical protein LDL59_01300 [Kaistella anthropi]|nr:hypothetical protein [Kaistella anthropi]